MLPAGHARMELDDLERLIARIEDPIEPGEAVDAGELARLPEDFLDMRRIEQPARARWAEWGRPGLQFDHRLKTEQPSVVEEGFDDSDRAVEEALERERPQVGALVVCRAQRRLVRSFPNVAAAEALIEFEHHGIAQCPRGRGGLRERVADGELRNGQADFTGLAHEVVLRNRALKDVASMIEREPAVDRKSV